MTDELCLRRRTVGTDPRFLGALRRIRTTVMLTPSWTYTVQYHPHCSCIQISNRIQDRIYDMAYRVKPSILVGMPEHLSIIRTSSGPRTVRIIFAFCTPSCVRNIRTSPSCFTRAISKAWRLGTSLDPSLNLATTTGTDSELPRTPHCRTPTLRSRRHVTVSEGVTRVAFLVPIST
jgi:hypothetical protein